MKVSPLEFVKSLRNKSVLFVGLGSELAGDDAAGKYFMEKLSELGEKNWEFIWTGMSPENYLKKMLTHPASILIFVDAFSFFGRDGEIRVFTREEISRDGFTHSYPIFLDLAAMEGKEIYILGIQPYRIAPIDEISEPVRRKIEEFVESLKRDA